MPKNTSAYMSDFIYHVKDYEYASGYRGLAIALGSLVIFLSILNYNYTISGRIYRMHCIEC